MATWHQERNGHALPKLTHPTLWRSYNPKGHLSIMTFESQEHCAVYCKKTGDIPLPPDNFYDQ
jgi:hypothetical protein